MLVHIIFGAIYISGSCVSSLYNYRFNSNSFCGLWGLTYGDNADRQCHTNTAHLSHHCSCGDLDSVPYQETKKEENKYDGTSCGRT